MDIFAFSQTVRKDGQNLNNVAFFAWPSRYHASSDSFLLLGSRQTGKGLVEAAKSRFGTDPAGINRVLDRLEVQYWSGIPEDEVASKVPFRLISHPEVEHIKAYAEGEDDVTAMWSTYRVADETGFFASLTQVANRKVATHGQRHTFMIVAVIVAAIVLALGAFGFF